MYQQGNFSIQNKSSARLWKSARFYVHTFEFSFLGSFSDFSLSPIFACFNPTQTRVETCSCEPLHVKCFFIQHLVNSAVFKEKEPYAEEGEIIQT